MSWVDVYGCILLHSSVMINKNMNMSLSISGPECRLSGCTRGRLHLLCMFFHFYLIYTEYILFTNNIFLKLKRTVHPKNYWTTISASFSSSLTSLIAFTDIQRHFKTSEDIKTIFKFELFEQRADGGTSLSEQEVATIIETPVLQM